MPRKSLHIAWLGFAGEDETGGGLPGVGIELLLGLAKLGHRIDCFFPSSPERELPARISDIDNLTLVRGTSTWQYNRWYSRTKLTSFVSGFTSRSFASLRLRKEVLRRHKQDPYDVLYQFAPDNLAAPWRLRRAVPVVAHPAQSSADALRFLVKERRLSFQNRPTYAFAIAAGGMWTRMRLERRLLRRARLVLCISEVFRQHLIRDYGLAREATVTIPNPIRLDRFDSNDRPLGTPPTIIILGRIATGKGIEDVVALARLLFERDFDVRFRIVGGTSIWSDYSTLLEDLPAENSEYIGRIPGSRVPGELARSDILLQASKYEAFALTVGEALAAGVPVVATTEVGAIENVDRSVAAAVRPGDVEGMAEAITTMVDTLARSPTETRSMARAEAERLFSPEVVCNEVSLALERLVDDVGFALDAVNRAADPTLDEVAGSPN